MPFVAVSTPDLAMPLNVYYERRGEPKTGVPCVLFISGTGGDLRVKPNVFDSALGSSFELLAFDQRGLGQTDKPESDYTMAGYADDAAALMDALGLVNAPVVGVSFGGMVAQELALRHPHKVSRLALACTSSGGAGGASYPLHELADLPEQERLEAHLAVADLRRDNAWREANPERWQALLQMAANARRTDVDTAGANRQLAARAGHDTFTRLGELTMPVLIMAGRYDGIAPQENQLALSAAIKTSELRWYEGGHLFMVQDKSAYPQLCDWLSAGLLARE